MVRVLQITDSHIFADPNKIFLGVNSLTNFKAVITAIREDSCNLVILTGDLSHDQSESSYQYIAKEITKLSYPVTYVPGNHDDPVLMAKILNKQPKEFIFDNWHIILLNSYYKGSDSGFLDNKELVFLDKTLQSHPDKHAIVFLHHQLISVGSPWLDPLGVQNHAEILQILDKYNNVKIVASGHIHQEFSAEYNNIAFFGAPATLAQFVLQSDKFEVDKLTPGYRWFDLYPDGKYKTGVVWL